MKKAKKMFSLLMVLIMVAALGAPAFADTNDDAEPAKITITNASIGEAYSLYQVFDVTFNTEAEITGPDGKTTKGTSASYMTNNESLLKLIDDAAMTAEKYDAWKEGDAPICPFVKGKEVEGEDMEGYFYITHVDPDNEPAGRGWLLANLAVWGGDSNYTKTKTAGSNTLVFGGDSESIPYGYYLISTTNGTEVTVDSTTPTAEVKDKNPQKPTTPTKTEDQITVAVGDTVTFTTTLEHTSNYITEGEGKTMKVNPIFNYTVTDTWTKGLAFNGASSIKSVILKTTETQDKKNANGYVLYLDADGNEYYLKPADDETEPATPETYYKVSDNSAVAADKVEGLGLTKETVEVETLFRELSASDTPAKNTYKLTYTEGALTYRIDIPWAAYTVDTSKSPTQTKVTDNYYPAGCTIEVVYELDVTDGILSNRESTVFQAENEIKYTFDHVSEGGGQPSTDNDVDSQNHPKTFVYSFGLSLRKFDKQGLLLKGAEFILYREVEDTIKIADVEYPLYQDANKVQYFLKDGKYLAVSDKTTEYIGNLEGLTKVIVPEYYQMNKAATYNKKANADDTVGANYPVYEETAYTDAGKLTDPHFLYQKHDAEGAMHYYYVDNDTDGNYEDKEYTGEAEDLTAVVGVYYPTNKIASLDNAEKNYAITWTRERGAATWILADDSYQTMDICGLDLDNYMLEEVKAPDGFNLPEKPYPVSISVDTEGNPDTGAGYTFEYSIDEVINGKSAKHGSSSNAYATMEITNGTLREMPTTGGAGTVALISCGALAFLGTAIILVTKKRMYNAG